jgi:diguanylate cyclase (GGDEF)-like protein
MSFLVDEWRRCSRLEHPICAVIIDIDNFKQFNDTYGHLKGDDCLVRVSRVLKELVHRPGDIFCRYGGEEFIYILGNIDMRRALGLC